MRIEPHAWLLTVPVTIVLVQLYFQPPHSLPKRLWRDMLEMEAQIWNQFIQLDWQSGPGRLHRARRAIFGLVVLTFAIISLASFGTFIGWLPR